MRNSYFTMTVAILAVAGISLAGPGHDHGKKPSKSMPLPNCPIMGEPINLAISTPTANGPVFFCCEGCIKKFTKAPAKYQGSVAAQRKALADRPKIQTHCPVTGEPVDGKIQVEQDGNKVSLCCKGCAKKYEQNPSKYATALANSYTYQTTCPVMGHTIDPTSFTKLQDGRTIYYCCDGCEDRLFGKPAKYAKHLASQGFQYNWAKIKKADNKSRHGGHDHDGHNHGGHDHDH